MPATGHLEARDERVGLLDRPDVVVEDERRRTLRSWRVSRSRRSPRSSSARRGAARYQSPAGNSRTVGEQAGQRSRSPAGSRTGFATLRRRHHAILGLSDSGHLPIFDLNSSQMLMRWVLPEVVLRSARQRDDVLGREDRRVGEQRGREHLGALRRASRRGCSSTSLALDRGAIDEVEPRVRPVRVRRVGDDHPGVQPVQGAVARGDVVRVGRSSAPGRGRRSSRGSGRPRRWPSSGRSCRSRGPGRAGRGRSGPGGPG